MSRRRYPTDLTDARWAVLPPLVPAPQPGRRPPAHEGRSGAVGRVDLGEYRRADAQSPTLAADSVVYSLFRHPLNADGAVPLCHRARLAADQVTLLTG